MAHSKITQEDKAEILRRYKEGESPSDITKILPYKRTTIKEFIRRSGEIRSQSESSILAVRQGKKYKAIKALNSKEIIEKCRLSHADCPWKTDPTKHPRWIKDRSKVFRNRSLTEERHLFRNMIENRDYTCELTGKRGGKLSCHHIKPVWKFPELRFDESNIIVIQLEIHKYFHCKYGFKACEHDWENFIKNKEYYALPL